MKTLVVGSGIKGFADLVDDITGEDIVVTDESKQVSSCFRINIVRVIGVETDAKTTSEFVDNVKSGVDVIDCVPVGLFSCGASESLVSLAEKLTKDTNYGTVLLTDGMHYSDNYFNPEPRYSTPSAQFVPPHIAHRKKFSNKPSKYRRK